MRFIEHFAFHLRFASFAAEDGLGRMNHDTARNRPSTFLSLQQNMLSPRSRQTTALFQSLFPGTIGLQFFIAEMAGVTKDGRLTAHRHQPTLLVQVTCLGWRPRLRARLHQSWQRTCFPFPIRFATPSEVGLANLGPMHSL